jgi:hypothetical protein
MNQALNATAQLIVLHGESCVYTKVIEGTYNVATGSMTNTETTFNIKGYRKHLRATQFNYPNLVGRESIMFYMLPDAAIGIPAVQDKVTFGTDVFTVDSVQSHIGWGLVCLYRLVCVKG